MSSAPNRSNVAATHASAWSGSPAFAANHATSPSMPAAAASSASGLRDDNMTRAPLAASSVAIASPMPRDEPVMSATWPS